MGHDPARSHSLSEARPGRRVGLAVAVGGWAVALGVAVAWIPLRSGHSNVVVALVQVAVVTGVGLSGRRWAVGAAALSAAASFTFFDTQPYEHFAISRQPDAVTAASIIVVALITGELAVRVARQGRSDRSVTGDLSRVREAASRLAAGEELVVMIGAVARDLRRQLHLRDCWFEAEPIPAGTLTVDREGRLAEAPDPEPTPAPEASLAPGSWSSPRSLGPPPKNQVLAEPADVALPVWALGQVVGHFVLQPEPGVFLERDRLQVALTLADQVGGALAAQAPAPLAAANPPLPHLRVIH